MYYESNIWMHSNHVLLIQSLQMIEEVIRLRGQNMFSDWTNILWGQEAYFTFAMKYRLYLNGIPLSHLLCQRVQKKRRNRVRIKCPTLTVWQRWVVGSKALFKKGLSLVQFNCYFSVSSGLHNQHRKLVDVKTEISLLGN